MTSDDEEDEEEYEDENEDEEDERMDLRANGSGESGGDVEEDDGEGDGGENSDEDEGSDEENGDDDGEGDEDEEDGSEGDEDDDEDEDEDEDDEDRSEEEETGDVEMTNGNDEAGSSHPSQPKGRAPIHLPAPPHLARRSLFIPSYSSPPASLSIEAIVAIPLPSAVHSIASSACSSYLLTGSQEGHVRCYDFWSSVNGGQVMTAQQRSIVGLGEGVSKAGVGRGWWSNEVEGSRDGTVGKRLEPVYSLACEGDGLWALTGTQSGPINLYTVRHSPGHLIHSLKGHTSVVSCMTLLPSEKGCLSGSWDGTLREWDLNTGQTVRTCPTHGAQLSSIALRPFAHPPSPAPSPNGDEQDDGEAREQDNDEARENVSISMGPDFFEKRDTPSPIVNGQSAPEVMQLDDPSRIEPNSTAAVAIPENDIAMSDKPSPFDPLFDDDAEGEEIPLSGGLDMASSPAPNHRDLASSSPGRPPALALPRTTPQFGAPSSASTPLFPAALLASTSRQGAASNIPLLSPAAYKSFSEDVLLTSSMDGQVVLIDRRVPVYDGCSGGVGRLLPGDKAPPWCMSACWSGDGTQVLAGRRNGTIDIWDVRRASSSSSPNVLRTLRTPTESGHVSCIVALPDGRHVATASQDNIRLWNTAEYFEQDDSVWRSKSRPPFRIIAGHHGGIVSAMRQ